MKPITEQTRWIVKHGKYAEVLHYEIFKEKSAAECVAQKLYNGQVIQITFDN